MADETKVIDGTFRGVRIRIASGGVNGGRKTSIKRFPNRDTNTIEDLGGVPRSYQLEIIVSDVQGQDYFAYRDSLLAALETKGTAVLEHPLYGRIENVVCTTFSLSENFSEFGRTIISASFEISENTGIPQQTSTALSQISASNNLVKNAAFADIAGGFSVTSTFKDNFSAASGTVNGMIDGVKGATDFVNDAVTGGISGFGGALAEGTFGAISGAIGGSTGILLGNIASVTIQLATQKAAKVAAEKINVFNNQLDVLSSNVNTLVSDPPTLAAATVSMFDAVDERYATSEAKLQSYAGLFNFGKKTVVTDTGDTEVVDDVVINPTTAGLIERQRNNDILNGSMNSLALSFSYLNAAQKFFETVDEIDTTANDLEVQYRLVIDSGASQAVKDAVTEQRVVTQQFFDEQRLTARQVITVFTPRTSTRLLSYQYYGDSESADEIGKLNEFADVSFIEGNVDILTA